MSKAIFTAELGNKSLSLGAIRTWRTEGEFAELRSIMSGIKSEVQHHWQLSGMVANDQNLSDHGRRARRAESAQDKTMALGRMAQQLAQIKRKAAARQAEAAKLPQITDPAQAVIMLAVAERLRTMPASEVSARLLAGMDEAAETAALALPELLTGIRPQLRNAVLQSRLERTNPELVAELSDLDDAIQTVEYAIRQGWNEVAGDLPPDAGLDPKVAVFEGDADAAKTVLEGVNERTIERITERLTAKDDAEREREKETTE